VPQPPQASNWSALSGRDPADQNSIALGVWVHCFQTNEGPYAGPNTRLGLATVVVWHAADHYGQMILY